MGITSVGFRESLVYKTGTTGTVDLSAATIRGTGMDMLSNTSFTAVASISLNNIFSTTYDNYTLIMTATSTATAATSMRMRVGGVDNSGATTYYNSNMSTHWNGGNGTESNNGATNWLIRRFHPTIISEKVINFYGPALIRPTQFEFTGIDAGSYSNNGSGYHTVAAAYDGITIFPASGTLTGNVRVYGIRN
jgi:hypothetical protein